MTEGDKIPCAWTNQGLQSKAARWSDGTPLGPSKLLQGWVDAMKSGANMNMTPPAPGSPAYNALRHITGPGSVLNLTDEQIKTILDYVTGKDQHKKEIQIQLKNGTLKLHRSGSGTAEAESKENQPPKSNTRRRRKGRTPHQLVHTPLKVVQQQEAALQQELRRLAKRVIAPLAFHPKYKRVEDFLRPFKDDPREALQKYEGAFYDGPFEDLVRGTVLDLRAVYQKILRREYQSYRDCIGDINTLWGSLGDIPDDRPESAQGIPDDDCLRTVSPMRELSREFQRIFRELLDNHEKAEAASAEVPPAAEKSPSSTWDCSPLDKPVLRAVEQNYCDCCTNPMNAQHCVPENCVEVLEAPQYEFLGRSVAAEKDPVKAPSFFPMGEGGLVNAKPLRTHVCAIDRCKHKHNPKHVGVLHVGDGDGTEETRRDKLEEALAALEAHNVYHYATCDFAKKKQRKGRKNK